MKYLILVLLLVSGIAHWQMYLSDPYVPDLYEQKRQRQQHQEYQQKQLWNQERMIRQQQQLLQQQRNQQLQQRLQQRPSLNY